MRTVECRRRRSDPALWRALFHLQRSKLVFTMFAFGHKFPAWKHFPKGLHVLVLDEDELALNDTKLKLEACNYSVTAFSNGKAALAAIQDQSMAFHLAIVEVNPTNADDSFNIVGAAKHLPTILLSNTKNVTIMMRGIEAGASEFIQKPLSENKLKNIWQHVFRKALSTGELILPTHLSPANDSAGEVNGIITQEMITVKEEPLDPSNNAETLALMQGEDDLFLEEYMDKHGHHDVQKISLLGEVKPDLDDNLMHHPGVRSPGPFTPWLKQAERVANVSGDGSPHSQDFASMKSGLEDDTSTDDCCSFLHDVKSDMEDMDGIFQSNSDGDGDEFQSLHDLHSLKVALCEDEDLQFHNSFDFQYSLTLADDLVDELSCIDMDSSILNDLPTDKSLQLSIECLDEGDKHDEEALLLAEVAKAEAGMASSCDLKSTPVCNSIHGHEAYEQQPTKSSDSEYSGKGNKSMQSKKKMKVDWTPELHRRFVQAVEQLGVDKAIPSRILEIMGVQHLTRHNIASHLQKYRSHKKHVQAREVEVATWNQRRQPRQSQVASRPAPLVPMGLHVWGHPTPEHFWPKPWQASEGTLWQQPPPVCLDAWGHPATRAPFYHPSHGHPQAVLRLPLAPMPGVANRAMPMQRHAEKMPGFHPPKEKVDAAISEVLKNPFTPLPLGLKPPSLESVLSELQRQGIKTVPPTASS